MVNALGLLSHNELISEHIQRSILITEIKRGRAGPAVCWAQFMKIKRKEKEEMNLAQFIRSPIELITEN
jgi:hypothetical protein